MAIIKDAEGNASRRQSLLNDNALHLVAKTIEADRINNRQLDRLKCQAFKFKAHDRVEPSHDLSTEMALRARDQLEKQGVPPDARIRDLLRLKKGAKVMMLKNMEINDDSGTVKLVNGSRGYVTKMVSAALMPRCSRSVIRSGKRSTTRHARNFIEMILRTKRWTKC